MQFDNYKFRCHYQGNLVSVPKPLTQNQKETLEAYRLKEKLTERQKKDWHELENKLNNSLVYSLSETAKNFLVEIFWNEKHGRQTQLQNKYFSKGLSVEKEARDLLSELFGVILTEDRERKSNDWVIGSRDIQHKDVVIDIKSAYNFNSFTKHLLENKHDFYFRQLDCYMELWGIKQALLAYVLVDTPFNIIDDEIRRLDWKENILNINGDVYDSKIETVVNLLQNHIYTEKALFEYTQQSSTLKIEWFKDFKEIPKNERVHLVEHSFDKVRIEQRNECLTLCRHFLNNIKINNNINFKLN